MSCISTGNAITPVQFSARPPLDRDEARAEIRLATAIGKGPIATDPNLSDAAD
jgi:hypothetical protein